MVELLDRKVKIRKLKRFTSQPKDDEIDIYQPKRIILERGELAQVYNSHKPMKLIAYIEYPINKLRGEHYHPFREEYNYVICGKLELAIENINTGICEKIIVGEGDLIYISPNIAHKMKAIIPAHIIEFSSKNFTVEGTIKYNLNIEL